MSRLKICDLSFCEVADANEVRGGLLSGLLIDSYYFLRESTIPTFQKESSQERDGVIDETFRDESGNFYARRVLSKDGKRESFSLVGGEDGVATAISSTRVSN